MQLLNKNTFLDLLLYSADSTKHTTKFPEPTTIPVEKIMMVLLHRPALLKASVKFLTDSSITDTMPTERD